ncbi:MAG: YggT family protein [Clostridia bacterium]|jgi:YggT family protein|nr:YggT family protein [Clostridia bacterium]
MLVDFVVIAFRVLYFLVIARVILSWIPIGNPNNTLVNFIYEITEPILAPIRRLIPRGSLPLDFSPIIALLLIKIIEGFVIGLLVR